MLGIVEHGGGGITDANMMVVEVDVSKFGVIGTDDVGVMSSRSKPTKPLLSRSVLPRLVAT